MNEKSHTHTHNLLHPTEVMNQEAVMYHHHTEHLLETAKATSTEKEPAN